MFYCTLLYVHSSIAIILMGKRELVALLNMSSWCLVMVERLFLAVPRGCLQFVIVVFPDHPHLLFLISKCLLEFGVWSLYGCGVLCILSSFAIIPLGKRYLVACLLGVMLLLLVPWVGLWCVIVGCPSHTHLLFEWNVLLKLLICHVAYFLAFTLYLRIASSWIFFYCAWA